MSLFGKVEHRKIELPFYYIREEEDIKAGAISIEAWGIIDGKTKYFYVLMELSDSVMYNNGDYEEMLKILEENVDRRVVLDLKYKKGKLKDFRIDKESLVRNLNDSRFGKIDILGWGINDKSQRIL